MTDYTFENFGPWVQRGESMADVDAQPEIVTDAQGVIVRIVYRDTILERIDAPSREEWNGTTRREQGLQPA